MDRYIFRRVSDSKKNKQLIGLLKREQSHYLGLNDTHMTEAGCDAVIIGSDEIFNCSSHSLWGINGQRFGNIPGVGTIISYAASCGYTDVSYLASEDRQEVIDGLKKLNYISVIQDCWGCFFMEFWFGKHLNALNRRMEALFIQS